MLCIYKLPQNICIMILSLGVYTLAYMFSPVYILLFSVVYLMQAVYTYGVIEKTVDFGPKKDKPESLFKD